MNKTKTNWKWRVRLNLTDGGKIVLDEITAGEWKRTEEGWTEFRADGEIVAAYMPGSVISVIRETQT